MNKFCIGTSGNRFGHIEDYNRNKVHTHFVLENP